jgi:hypothetical protein
MNEKIYSDVYKKVDKLIKEKSLLIAIILRALLLGGEVITRVVPPIKLVRLKSWVG